MPGEVVLVDQVTSLNSGLARRDGQSKAYLDEVTGALTRGAGRQLLTAEIERAHRSLTALALVFVDVDGLKTVNDTYGQAEGDRLLVAVTSALRQCTRQYDLVVRYGDEEFLCALPGSDIDAARAAIHRAQEQLEVALQGASFSAGFAELLPDEQLDELIRRADECLDELRARRASPGFLPQSTPYDGGLARSAGKSPGVACAVCGERIPLSTFVVLASNALTRFADCPRCAETTVIQVRANPAS